MDWISIIVALLGALAGGGLTALLTVRETRKSKILENKEKELDLADKQKDEVISDWKELAEMYRTRVDELKTLLEHRTDKLETKEELITELHTKLDSSRTKCAVAEILKCVNVNCTQREPKLGTRSVDVEEIISTNN